MVHATNILQIAANEIFRCNNEDSATPCADSRVMDHMIPHYSAFLSYHPSTDTNDVVYLGDDTHARIAGHGTSVIKLNGQLVLLRNAMHVPTMKQPPCSFTRH